MGCRFFFFSLMVWVFAISCVDVGDVGGGDVLVTARDSMDVPYPSLAALPVDAIAQVDSCELMDIDTPSFRMYWMPMTWAPVPLWAEIQVRRGATPQSVTRFVDGGVMVMPFDSAVRVSMALDGMVWSDYDWFGEVVYTDSLFRIDASLIFTALEGYEGASVQVVTPLGAVFLRVELFFAPENWFIAQNAVTPQNQAAVLDLVLKYGSGVDGFNYRLTGLDSTLMHEIYAHHLANCHCCVTFAAINPDVGIDSIILAQMLYQNWNVQ